MRIERALKTAHVEQTSSGVGVPLRNIATGRRQIRIALCAVHLASRRVACERSRRSRRPRRCWRRPRGRLGARVPPRAGPALAVPGLAALIPLLHSHPKARPIRAYGWHGGGTRTSAPAIRSGLQLQSRWRKRMQL